MTVIAPIQAREAVGVNTFDFKGTFREFYYELTRMLREYGDPDKDMIIGGTFVPAEQKYSPYGTILFDTVSSEMEQRQETLLGTWTALFQLEKSLAGSA